MSHVLHRGVAGDMNEKPHTLVPLLDHRYGSAIRWAATCPYETARACGVNVECTEHPRPEEPKGLHVPGPDGWPVPADDFREEWDAWAAADEAWSDEHPGGPWHPGDECWFVHSLTEGEFEPEYYLAPLPEGPLTGPIEVAVAFDGSYEESEPVFYPWKEETP